MLGKGKRKLAWLMSKAREIIKIKKLVCEMRQMYLGDGKKNVINPERINNKQHYS